MLSRTKNRRSRHQNVRSTKAPGRIYRPMRGIGRENVTSPSGQAARPRRLRSTDSVTACHRSLQSSRRCPRAQHKRGQTSAPQGKDAERFEETRKHCDCKHRPACTPSSPVTGLAARGDQRYDFWKRARAPFPPNFLGSIRLGSATSRVRSYWTRTFRSSREEAASANVKAVRHGRRDLVSSGRTNRSTWRRTRRRPWRALAERRRPARCDHLRTRARGCRASRKPVDGKVIS